MPFLKKLLLNISLISELVLLQRNKVAVLAKQSFIQDWIINLLSLLLEKKVMK